VRRDAATARNLNAPFADLKRQVAAGQGLDAAIHSVKPAADASAEATHAKEQAQQDMRAPRGGNAPAGARRPRER